MSDNIKQTEQHKSEKKINPVYEYLTQFRGQVFVTDPNLMI